MPKKELEFLQQIFPKELTEYFTITKYELQIDCKTNSEYWMIDFEENNDVPKEYNAIEYESKGFMDSHLIQDFPIRGKAVYLRIKKRRWRHKQTGKTIRRDYSFIADGSKITKELSDFLKGTG